MGHLFVPWVVLTVDGHSFVATYDTSGGIGYTLPEWRTGLTGTWHMDDDGSWIRADGVRPSETADCEHGMYHQDTGAWRAMPVVVKDGKGRSIYPVHNDWIPCFPFVFTAGGMAWVDARQADEHQ